MPFLRKSAQSIPPFPAGAVTGTSPGSVQGRAFWDMIGQPEPLYPEPNFANAAAYGFEENELVYACVMEKATSLPDASFRVYGPDGQGEPREDHPLRRLIANPNPMTTEFELIELTSIYMDLAGIAFWEIVTDRMGNPIQLWPLRPDMVRLYPMSDHMEYGYVIGGNRVVPLGRDVLAFKYPNPMNPPLGQAPMRSANRAVALDNEATDFVKALLQNHAVPGVVIETEQKIDEALTERLTNKWLERFSGHLRGSPAFLQKGMKVHSLGLDLGQLEFPDLRTISESRICAAFGVPPILVGAKVGLDRSTFANYSEARRSFWEETLLPIQKRIQQVIVKELMPRTEGVRPRRSVAKFDNSEVVALRESEQVIWDTALNALRAGGITINEFCRRVGLPPKASDVGDVFLIPAGVTPVSVPAEAVTLTGAGQTPNVPAADDGQAEDDQAGKTITEGGSWSTWLEAKADPDDAARPFAAAIAKVVAEQRAEVLAEADKSRATLALHQAKTIPWDEARWDKRLADAMVPHMKEAAFRGARGVDDGVDTGLMVGYVKVAARNVAHRWNETTRVQVEGAALGAADPAEGIRHVFELAAGGRALTLARSMRTDMRNFGKVDTAKRVGLSTKTWEVNSGNPREEHAMEDGETVPVSEPFSNGDMWPSGPNCMCDVTFN